MACCQTISRVASEILRSVSPCASASWWVAMRGTASGSSQVRAFSSEAFSRAPNSLLCKQCFSCLDRSSGSNAIRLLKSPKTLPGNASYLQFSSRSYQSLATSGRHTEWRCVGWNLRGLNCRFQSKSSQQQQQSGKTAAKPKEDSASGKVENAESVGKQNEAKKQAFWHRLKQKAKDYGKTYLIVHYVSTYTLWFIPFYYLSYTGVNIRWLLEQVNTSEATMQWIENSRFSHAAIAYVFIKVISPLRLVVSIGLTELTVRALRARGYMAPVADADKLRNMVRTEMRSRVAHIRQVHEARKQKRARVRRDRVARIKGHTAALGKRTLRAITSRWKAKSKLKLNGLGLLRRLPK